MEANKPYQRVDNNKSVWEGAAIGAGFGALKVAAVDAPLEALTHPKVYGKLKEGNKVRKGLESIRSHMDEGMKAEGIAGKVNRFAYGGGKMRVARFGVAMATGGLIGGIMAGKD